MYQEYWSLGNHACGFTTTVQDWVGMMQLHQRSFMVSAVTREVFNACVDLALQLTSLPPVHDGALVSFVV